MFLFRRQKNKPHENKISWKIGDVCDVQDPKQGAWYSGTIVSIEQGIFVIQIPLLLKPNEVTVTEEGLAKPGTCVLENWTRIDHTSVNIGEKYDAKDQSGRWYAGTIQNIGKMIVFVTTETKHHFWTSHLAPLHELTDQVCIAKFQKQYQQEEEKNEQKRKDYEWRFENHCLQVGDGVDIQNDSGAWYSRVVTECNGPQITLNSGVKTTLPNARLAKEGTRVKVLGTRDKQMLKQFRNSIQPFAPCDAKDSRGHWYEALYLSCESGLYKVYFRGFGTVEEDAQDIAPRNFYTCKEISAALVYKKYVERYQADKLDVHDSVDVFDEIWYEGIIMKKAGNEIEVIIPKLEKTITVPYPSRRVLPIHTCTRTLTEHEIQTLHVFHQNIKPFSFCDAQLNANNWARALFIKKKENEFVVCFPKLNQIVEVDNIAPIIPFYAATKEMVDMKYGKETGDKLSTISKEHELQVCENLFDTILCYDKEVECLEQLQDVSSCDRFRTIKDNQTFLHAAVRGARLRICEWLIKHYPLLLTVADKEGEYPIHFAMTQYNDELIHLLVYNRPNSIFFKNNAGLSPFQFATQYKDLFWEISQQSIKTTFVEGELCDALDSKGMWVVSQVVHEDENNVALSVGERNEARMCPKTGLKKYCVAELHFYTQGPFVPLLKQ